MNQNDILILKCKAIKSHKDSYTRKHGVGTDIENHSIKRNKWVYQAVREGATYHISIQAQGDYYELNDEKFKELELKYFKDIWEITDYEK